MENKYNKIKEKGENLEFNQKNYEILKIIPRLTAKAYDNKFESLELFNKRLNFAIILIINDLIEINLLMEIFWKNKEKKEILNKLLIKCTYSKRRCLI